MSLSKEETTKSKLHRPRYVIGAVSIILLCILLWFWWRMQGPAVGTVSEPGARSDMTAEAEAPEQEIIGKYVAFRCEAGYENQTADDNQSYLEQIQIGKLGPDRLIGNKSIAVAVRNYNESTLDSESAYSSRKQAADRYELLEQKIGDHTVTSFRSRGTGEANWTGIVRDPAQQRIAIISLTSFTLTPSQLEAEFLELVASFRWL